MRCMALYILFLLRHLVSRIEKFREAGPGITKVYVRTNKGKQGTTSWKHYDRPRTIGCWDFRRHILQNLQLLPKFMTVFFKHKIRYVLLN